MVQVGVPGPGGSIRRAEGQGKLVHDELAPLFLVEDRAALPDRSLHGGQRAFAVHDAQIRLAQEGQGVAVDGFRPGLDDRPEQPDRRPVPGDGDGCSPGKGGMSAVRRCCHHYGGTEPQVSCRLRITPMGRVPAGQVSALPCGYPCRQSIWRRLPVMPRRGSCRRARKGDFMTRVQKGFVARQAEPEAPKKAELGPDHGEGRPADAHGVALQGSAFRAAQRQGSDASTGPSRTGPRDPASGGNWNHATLGAAGTGPVAQWIEHPPPKRKVARSSRAGTTRKISDPGGP